MGDEEAPGVEQAVHGAGGMIISFAWTTEAFLLGLKTVTRRDYDDAYAARFRPGTIHDAWDRSPRAHGKKVGRLLIVSVRREPVQRMRDDRSYAIEEWRKEGGELHWPTVDHFLATPWTGRYGDPVRIEFKKVDGMS